MFLTKRHERFLWKKRETNPPRASSRKEPSMTPSRNHLSMFALLALSLGVFACVVTGGAVPTATSLPPSPTPSPSPLPTQTATTPLPTATPLPPIIEEANVFDLTAVHTLTGHGNSVKALAFSPDGETLVVSTGGSSNRQEHRLRHRRPVRNVAIRPRLDPRSVRLEFPGRQRRQPPREPGRTRRGRLDTAHRCV